MAVVEVVDKECDKTVRFDAVEVGETFRYDNAIYLKYERASTSNAFSFNDNARAFFHNGDRVVPVKCKLVVEG